MKPPKKKPEGAVKCSRCGCTDMILREKFPIGVGRMRYVRECRHCGTVTSKTVKLIVTDLA